MPKSQTEILSQMIELLTPLNSDDRQRLVGATLTFLGENPIASKKAGIDEVAVEESTLPPRANAWRKQNGLSAEQLNQIFHIAGDKVDILSIPGASNREMTINAYVFAGLGKYLASGDPKFDDRFAREVCSNAGCYDATNHAAYLKARGNLFTGDKNGGWTLTSPGLKHAADLVKALTK
jgi:hypothetical protein